MILLSSFSNRNFLLGSFLRFLLESMVQNHQIIPCYKSQNAKDIMARLNPYFPDIICSSHFFEIFDRNHFQFFDKLHYPSYFLSLFRRQSIQKLFYRAMPRFRSIKSYFPHSQRLTYMLTLSRGSLFPYEMSLKPCRCLAVKLCQRCWSDLKISLLIQ